MKLNESLLVKFMCNYIFEIESDHVGININSFSEFKT